MIKLVEVPPSLQKTHAAALKLQGEEGLKGAYRLTLPL